MTIRVDSASLIAGKIVVSKFAGHGIPASQIPSTGTSGPGYLYNDIVAQGVAPTDEMRGEILTWPSAGTLTVNEDSSFSFTGAPNGSYSFTYRGYRNGVSYGDFTVQLTIGSGVELEASALAESVASASLLTQIRLAASAACESVAYADLGGALVIALQADAIGNSTATADLSVLVVPFTASAASESSAIADLLTAIELSAAAASVSSGSVVMQSDVTPIEYRRVDLAIDGKMVRFNTQVHQASDVSIDVVVTGEVPQAIQAKYVAFVPARSLIAQFGHAAPPPPNLIEISMPVGVIQTEIGYRIAISRESLRNLSGRFQHEFSIMTQTGAIGFLFTGELQVKQTNSRY